MEMGFPLTKMGCGVRVSRISLRMKRDRGLHSTRFVSEREAPQPPAPSSRFGRMGEERAQQHSGLNQCLVGLASLFVGCYRHRKGEHPAIRIPSDMNVFDIYQHARAMIQTILLEMDAS